MRTCPGCGARYRAGKAALLFGALSRVWTTSIVCSPCFSRGLTLVVPTIGAAPAPAPKSDAGRIIRDAIAQLEGRRRLSRTRGGGEREIVRREALEEAIDTLQRVYDQTRGKA